MRILKGKKKYILVLVCIIISIIFIKKKTSQEISVESWNNIYNENNINFFYSDVDDEKIEILKYKNNIEEKVKDEKDKLKKAIKTIDVINETITFDDIENTNRINAIDILKDKENSKKASARDIGIIYRDTLSSLGYTARLGEFKRLNASYKKEKNYYVVEYWSRKYNKWIMIDFIDRGYFYIEDFPCSAMELMEKDIDYIGYNGNSKKSDHISMYKKVLYSYTINIDNTTNMEKSNTYITYIKDKTDITLNFKNNYLPPTVFTENINLINKNPIERNISQDEKAYIVLMKKEDNNKESAPSFVLGAFKDGKIMDKYYIKENNEEFTSVKKYKDISLIEGRNKIELSLNGKDTISSIDISYKK